MQESRFTNTILFTAVFLIWCNPDTFAQTSLQGKVEKMQLNPQAQQTSLQGGENATTKLPFSGTNYKPESGQQDLQPEQPSEDQPNNPDQLPYNGGFHLSSALPSTTLPKWRVYSIPDNSPVNAVCPGVPVKLLHFQVIGTQFTTNQMVAWNKWTANLLHMIYANLQTFHGTPSNTSTAVIIHVRNDGRIKTGDELVHDANERAIKESIDALNGLPQLAFPAPDPTDTVRVECYVRFGGPIWEHPTDVWGRQKPELENGKWWDYKDSW